MGWICQAREACVYHWGVIDPSGVLLSDNGVFKKKCFGFRMGHNPGKEIHVKHFQRSKNISRFLIQCMCHEAEASQFTLNCSYL